MATDADFVDYIAEQAGLGERLTRKKMFGEYALYLDGKVVAFVCDNSLFIKPTAAVEQLAPDLPLRPPYPVAKPYPVADELLDDSEALQRLLIRTAALLPVPRPRTKKSPKKKTGNAASGKAVAAKTRNPAWRLPVTERHTTTSSR